MGVAVEEAAAEIKKASTKRKPITLTSTDRKGMARAVVVERRPSRTLIMNRGARQPLTRARRLRRKRLAHQRSSSIRV